MVSLSHRTTSKLCLQLSVRIVRRTANREGFIEMAKHFNTYRSHRTASALGSGYWNAMHMVYPLNYQIKREATIATMLVS